MADLSVNDLITRLATIVRDSSNSVWTLTEMLEALTQAVDNDPYVVQQRRDSSLTSLANQVNYALPTGFVSVDELWLDLYDDGFGLPIDPVSWEVDDSDFYFNRRMKFLPAGHKLILIGQYKLTSTDLIPIRYQAYVLHLAAVRLLENLTFSKAGAFLKNDTTMAEIMQAISYHKAEATNLRKNFLNRAQAYI